jgi:hypothetical protein
LQQREQIFSITLRDHHHWDRFAWFSKPWWAKLPLTAVNDHDGRAIGLLRMHNFGIKRAIATPYHCNIPVLSSGKPERTASIGWICKGWAALDIRDHSFLREEVRRLARNRDTLHLTRNARSQIARWSQISSSSERQAAQERKEHARDFV